MLELCRGRGFLGREAFRAIVIESETGTEEGPQIVLRCDDRNAPAAAIELREDRRCPKEPDTVHHDFLARLGIVKIVAANPMNLGGLPRRDGQIVRVSKGRDDRVGEAVGPRLP